jgi:hypothetical protein
MDDLPIHTILIDHEEHADHLDDQSLRVALVDHQHHGVCERSRLLPRRPAKRGKVCVTLCILGCALLERLVFYSVVGNLVLFCQTKLDMDSDNATTVSFVFIGNVIHRY